MLSFLSWFNWKKKGKPKRASAATAPSSPATSRRSAQPSRFFSLRPGPSTRPGLHHRRRSSSETESSLTRTGEANGRTRDHDQDNGKSSNRKQEDYGNTAQGKAKGEGKSTVPVKKGSLILPKLDFQVQASDEEALRSPLGLESIGRQPKLSENEVKVLDQLRLGVEEVASGWKCFGQALRQAGVQEPGILLPRPGHPDPDTQRYLLGLFVLSIRPALAPELPSITSVFPTSPAGDTSAPNPWSERLQLSLGGASTPEPHDLAEILKFLLHRLQSSTPSRPATPLLDESAYLTFVRAEAAVSYSPDSYDKLFRVKLDSPVASYIEDIFEVWAGIVTYAEMNGMTAGRLCLLLGWWVWGLGTHVTPQVGWKELYDQWQAAAKRSEHLFYAWIRWQSTKQSLPIKLMQLVQDYPFGGPTTSSDHPPSPPPSSFSRQTLHVTLASERPIDHAGPGTREIIRLALQCHATSETPLWTCITRSSQGNVKTIEHILSDDSERILHAEEMAKEESPATPDSQVASERPSQNAPSFYRPFSTLQRTRPSELSFPSPQRSQSYGDLRNGNPATTAPRQSAVRQNSGLSASASHSDLETSTWNDFEKIGFPDSPVATDLRLSPPVVLKKLSPEARDRHDEGHRKVTAPKRPTAPASHEGYSVIGEEVIELDDMFWSFVEDGRHDPSTTETWPQFALVRFDTPPQIPAGPASTASAQPVEWLLVSFEYRPPPPSEPRVEAEDTLSVPRSASPGGASTTSRMSIFGFRDFASGFRRSSSYGIKQGGFRRSLLGASSRTLSKDMSGHNLGSVTESAPVELGPPVSAGSSTPTEVTIGEMGEMIKVNNSFLAVPTQPQDGNHGDQRQTDNLSKNTEPDDRPTTESLSENAKSVQQLQPGRVSEETTPDEWRYKAEGGAHVVFGYMGVQPTYRGKVLRIRKASATGADRQMEVADQWPDQLLPKLVPARLLVPAQRVNVSSQWLDELLQSVSEARPGWRKENHTPTTGNVKAWLMQDLTAKDERNEDHHIISVEIKPKWGFLPRPEFLHPPESDAVKSRHSRFVMHQYLRDPANLDRESYDPLDLYSEDEVRIQRAVNGLAAEWKATCGNGNNLRLAIDGVMVLLGQPTQLSVVSADALLADVWKPLVGALRSSAALRVLRDLQSRLDPRDISDLARRFRLAHPDSELFDAALLPEPNIQELSDFVELYLSDPAAGVVEDQWTLRQCLIAYTLSAVFKDCSIFVSIPITFSGNHIESVDGNGTVKLIDLDLKPMKSLRKWFDLDEQIWRHWLSTHPDSVQAVTDDDVQATPRPLHDSLVGGATPSVEVGPFTETNNETGTTPSTTAIQASPSPRPTSIGTPLTPGAEDADAAEVVSPSNDVVPDIGQTQTPRFVSHVTDKSDNGTTSDKSPVLALSTAEPMGDEQVTDARFDKSSVEVTEGIGSAEGDEGSTIMGDESSLEPRARRSLAPSPSPRPAA